jgi:hypothetical protein
LWDVQRADLQTVAASGTKAQVEGIMRDVAARRHAVLRQKAAQAILAYLQTTQGRQGH